MQAHWSYSKVDGLKNNLLAINKTLQIFFFLIFNRK